MHRHVGRRATRKHRPSSPSLLFPSYLVIPSNGNRQLASPLRGQLIQAGATPPAWQGVHPLLMRPLHQLHPPLISCRCRPDQPPDHQTIKTPSNEGVFSAVKAVLSGFAVGHRRGIQQGFIFGHAGRGGKQHVGGAVESRLCRILQYPDDEAHGDHLHGDVVADAKQAARQRISSRSRRPRRTRHRH